MHIKRERTIRVVEEAAQEAANLHQCPVTVLAEFLGGDEFVGVWLELNSALNDPFRGARMAKALAQAAALRLLYPKGVGMKTPQITVVTGQGQQESIDEDILLSIEKALYELISKEISKQKT